MSVATLTRDLTRALVALVALTLITGVAYPVVVWAVGQVAFSYRAGGSLIRQNGVVVGSSLIGQAFPGARWFHSRPSAVDYNADSSGASNLGPNSKALADAAHRYAVRVAREDGVPLSSVPADLATASASGLDPDITVAAARVQVDRVARARGLSPARVEGLIARATSDPTLGVLGATRVNVLRLNLALQGLR